VQNLKSLTATAEAAVEEKSPVILQITPSVIKYAGLPYIVGLAKTAAQLATVPISIHLNHKEDCQKQNAIIRKLRKSIAACSITIV
jgi:fructose/tagatose bisphosphate aldolase